MTDRWTASFPRSSASASMSLRVYPGINACMEGDQLWITGAGSTEPLENLLKKIPAIIRYTVHANNSITRTGRRIPERELPIGPWVAFSSLVDLKPQPAALPGRIQNAVALTLVRDSSNGHVLIGEATALMVSIQSWADYAAAASQVRLNALRFAARSDGLALVLGSPLPPLPGKHFANLQGILVPAGYRFDPDMEPSVLRRLLDLAPEDVALFKHDCSYELIGDENFVKASRSAARRSAGAF